MSERHEIDVEQGSDEWIAIRKMNVTATDASALLGINPFPDAANTMNQLYWKKVLPDNYEPTAPMLYGTKHEEDARVDYEDQSTLDYPAKVFRRVIDGVSFMASLDGHSDFDNSVLEIKCPYKGKSSYLWKNLPEIPENYRAQMEVQCRVVGTERVDFMVWTPDGHRVMPYYQDDDLWERILEQAKIFYGFLMDGNEPPLTDKDVERRSDAEWFEVTDALKTVRAQLKKLKTQESVLRQQLIDLASGVNSEGNGVRLEKRYTSRGYDMQEMGKHFNIEAYKREPSATFYVREMVTADNQLN